MGLTAHPLAGQSSKSFDAYDNHIPFERLDICTEIIGKLIQQVQTLRVMVVLCDLPEPFTIECAFDVALMRIIQPKCPGNILCCF